MFDKEVYTERRHKLSSAMHSGVLLFLGNSDVPMNYPSNTFHWRQDSNFLYFFGLDFTGLAALIDLDNGTEHLYGNNVDIDDIIWMGPQMSTSDKAELAGVDHYHPFSQLINDIKRILESGRPLHFTPPYRAENKILLEQLTGIKPTEQTQRASVELIKAIVALRSIKEGIEITEIEKAIETGYIMHTTAMRMAVPGVRESEIAGAIEGIALSAGGMLSFPAIVTVRGETLHNHYHGNILKKNDLLLIDAGAETSMHYASDHTRTVSVGGTFTLQQKDIYQAVLDTLETATAAVRPGKTNIEVHMLAALTLAGRLKDIGLMKGDIQSAVEQGAHALFFPHGLGHMMGLDVHDMEDMGENYVGYDNTVKRSEIFGTAFLRLGREYQPGFVLTIEPGCYFIPALIDQWSGEQRFADYINYDKLSDWRKFGGIRIEDDVLVTLDGCRVLGKSIPRSVSEIEAIVPRI